MTRKELAINIYNFLRLNPKKVSSPKVSKYNPSSFFVIQEIYKSIESNIDFTSYNDIFYNSTQKLLGQEWLKIFLNAKNILDYHNLLRINYLNCDYKRFKQKISHQCFAWFYNSTQKIVIENSEFEFDLSIQQDLIQIRKFLNEEDWSNYFFNLQKIMHKQIIVFLDWKNKPLNYIAYSKILTKKLKNIINNDHVEKYIATVQKINLYRNTFAKASPIKTSLQIDFFNQTATEKKVIAWEIYFNLLEFINLTNLDLNI